LRPSTNLNMMPFEVTPSMRSTPRGKAMFGCLVRVLSGAFVFKLGGGAAVSVTRTTRSSLKGDRSPYRTAVRTALLACIPDDYRRIVDPNANAILVIRAENATLIRRPPTANLSFETADNLRLCRGPR